MLIPGLGPALFLAGPLAVVLAASPDGDLLTSLRDASGPTVLAVIVIGAIREWWVPGATHRRIVRERDDLLQLALRSTHTLDRAVSIAESRDERDRQTADKERRE